MDLLSNWPHKSKNSNTDEFRSNINSNSMEESKRTLKKFLYSDNEGSRTSFDVQIFPQTHNSLGAFN